MKAKKTNKKEVNDKTTLIIDFLLFVFCIVLGTILLINSFTVTQPKTVAYQETSNIDYKVYLNENSHFEQEYLDKDMLYIASLIDYLKINFNYRFEIAEKSDFDFYYTINGKLVIYDQNSKKTYFEKNYDLVEQTSVPMLDDNKTIISKSFNLNYDYYNDLANSFKSSYGLDTESKLIVYMTVFKKSNNEQMKAVDGPSVMNLEIPLSKKSVEISLDCNDLNTMKNVVYEESKVVMNYAFIAVSTVLIILSIVLFIIVKRKLFALITKNSKYDKYIKKILREYDRLIVESTNVISFDKKEVIKLEKFTELLDVHDNLQLPILYQVVEKHKKANFYILQEKIVYLYTVTEKNIEGKK